jgi:hypothetical protein
MEERGEREREKEWRGEERGKGWARGRAREGSREGDVLCLPSRFAVEENSKSPTTKRHRPSPADYPEGHSALSLPRSHKHPPPAPPSHNLSNPCPPPAHSQYSFHHPDQRIFPSVYLSMHLSSSPAIYSSLFIHL